MTRTTTALSFLIVGTLAGASAPDAHAIPISVQYSVQVNSEDPGLVVETMDLAINPYVTDLTLGVPVVFDLFRIWTNETSVNADDLTPRNAFVYWNFLYPPGSIVSGGATLGKSFFSESGEIVWVSPLAVEFANGAQIVVSLSGASFNGGFLGLTPGQDHGANVTATMTLTRAPVPEPSSLMLLGLGLGGAWAASRRSRARRQTKSSRHG